MRRIPSCLYLCRYLVPLIFVFFFKSVVAQDDNSTSHVAVAEADLLWPREGDSFALNDKGMGVIVAIQNYAEAQKHGWKVNWLMCQNRTDKPGFRECTFSNDYSDQRLVLRNDSATTDGASTDGNHANGSDVYIEINHAYWGSNSGRTDFNYTFGGVYTFDWSFRIGPWCEVTNRSTEYWISQGISRGSFNVTLVPSAAYPEPTAATCASPLGTVGYAGTTTFNFQMSVANEPGCVQTQSVDVAPSPCRATLNSNQLASAAAFMGWNGTSPRTASETGRSLAIANTVSVPGVAMFSFLTFILSNYL